MSRYALWLIALCTPLIAEGAHRLEQRRGLTALLICVSVGLSLVAFRPEWGDRAGDSPNPLAAAIWSRMPGLDNPLPEVFAERTTGADGQPPIPSATPGCEKVLVRGDGREAWWPFPCEPREAPPACTASGAVCYVNNGTFSIAPAQPRLTFDSVPERAWSIRQPNRLRELLPRLGPGARIMRRTAMVRRLVESTSLFPLFIVEGPTGTVFWAGTRDKPAPAIRIRALRASEIELRDGPSGTLIGSWNVAAGEHTVPVPTGARIMVIVTEST
jgi:hypothetical protein